MKILRIAFLGFTLLGSLLVAQSQAEVELKEDYPGSYTVKLGDTLWDISAKFLQSPWLWPEIWQVNPQVANPHLIYPGDVLSLIYIDGKPRLVINRGDVKLSPQIRTSPLGNAIPAIPLEAISTFLSRSRVLSEKELEAAPYIIAGERHRLLSGAGDRVYTRGEFTGDTPSYGIYRRGQEFVDPETKEELGLQVLDIGAGQVLSSEDGTTTVALNRSNEEVRVRDRLLPFEDEEILATFYPKAPDVDIDGAIIAVEGGVANIGAFDVVVVNRGSRESLAVGDVLAVNKTGEKVKDPVTGKKIKLPSERAGLMIIFKAFEKVSYGLILGADQPLKVGDEITNP